MLENLSYIYQAMYALDLYDSLTTLLGTLCWLLPLAWAVTWVATVLASSEYGTGVFGKMWKATKWFQLGSLFIFFISIFLLVIMPSKNTVKAYIGVKAVQAVGNYISTQTNVPERSKHTITRLWDKVDGYIESIDFEDESEAVSAVADSTTAKANNLVNDVKEKVGKEKVDSLVKSVKQQAIDSVMATIKK